MDMGISRRHISGLIFLAGVTLATSFHAHHVQQVREHQEQPYGRFTSQQILTKAQRTCSELVPNGVSLFMTETQRAISSHLNTPLRVWEVDCQEVGRPEDMIFLRWNADTGELLVASCTSSTASGTTSQTLNQKDAAICARDWLERLECGAAGGWRTSGPATMSRGGTWAVQLVNEQKRMRLVIDSSTGTLLTAMRGIDR
jgi:hypothetical protein